jgi:hypothetical protein
LPDLVVRFDPPLPWGRAFHRCRQVYPKAGLHPVKELAELPPNADLW